MAPTVLEELTDALGRQQVELDVVAWLSAKRRALLVRDSRSAEYADERMNRALDQLAAQS